MRVAVFGQPFWAKRLSENLNLYGNGAVQSAAVCLPRLTRRNIVDIQSADVLIRVGYRPGAVTLRGVAFDAFWSMVRSMNRRARVFFFWIGTDVLDAMRDFSAKGGRARLERAKRDNHVAGAPWLTAELAEIGIEARTAYFPGIRIQYSGTEFPKRFSVLTYIPDLRYRFYGGPLIYDCAAALPLIHFNVIGGNGDWVHNKVSNMTFWGWQGDVGQFYRDSVVVMRIVQHDALGGSALEGLAAGRHVIYSYPLPFTQHVRFEDTRCAVAALSSMFASFSNGHLQPNLGGQEYVRTEFDLGGITHNLIEILEAQ
jgi:hypothetical protein